MFCSTVILALIFLLVLSLEVLSIDLRATDPGILEDARLEAPALIRKYGYPCEVHELITEDGYILEMHRIPPRNSTSGRRPVVLLFHGLLSSSAEWVLMSPGNGFAYILSDAGYDVWMGNARGNTYSRNHTSLSTSSSAFWKFTWHEIGFYDVPASIDYILQQTGESKIQYAAFSQGTTAFWVMMSTKPEYNEKIIAMQALAPVAFVGNIKSPFVKAIAPFTNSLETISKILGANEMMPNGKLNELAGQALCLEEAITQSLCTNILFLICGFDEEQLNTTMLPIILGHTPAGAATRQFVHFGQLYNSEKFVQFDHGWLKNRRIYGTSKPPQYDLTAVKVPVFLHYADNDWIAAPKDVMLLAEKMPSAIGIYRVPLAKFNHMDFVFGNDANELVYKRVMKIMSQFI